MNSLTKTDQLLTFPCEFPIKVMGRATDNLKIIVIDIIRRHEPNLLENTVKSRSSSGNKYICITVTITAKDRQQLDDIYHDLCAHNAVLMAL